MSYSSVLCQAVSLWLCKAPSPVQAHSYLVIISCNVSYMTTEQAQAQAESGPTGPPVGRQGVGEHTFHPGRATNGCQEVLAGYIWHRWEKWKWFLSYCSWVCVQTAANLNLQLVFCFGRMLQQLSTTWYGQRPFQLSCFLVIQRVHSQIGSPNL